MHQLVKRVIDLSKNIRKSGHAGMILHTWFTSLFRFSPYTCVYMQSLSCTLKVYITTYISFAIIFPTNICIFTFKTSRGFANNKIVNVSVTKQIVLDILNSNNVNNIIYSALNNTNVKQ